MLVFSYILRIDGHRLTTVSTIESTTVTPHIVTARNKIYNNLYNKIIWRLNPHICG